MNSKAPKIFVVDDDPYFRIAVVGILRANGYQVAVESRPLSVINSSLQVVIRLWKQW